MKATIFRSAKKWPLVVAMPLVLLGLSPTDARPNKILFSPKTGESTILELNNVNSDKAIVKFRREMDDTIETCSRETPNLEPKALADCSISLLNSPRNRILTRRAYCSRDTIYTEFGNFSLVNTHKEAVSVYAGKTYRPVRTDWKNHKNDEIIGNSSADNTSVIIDTFKVLCPYRFDQLFKGLDPH